MPKKAKVVELTPESLQSLINKRYGPETMVMASHPSLYIERIPTGILSIDYITGGGFPRGRHVELYGNAAVGKCLEENEEIFLSDGSKTKVSLLKGKSFSTFAWSVDGRQVMSKAYAEDNGKKLVYEIETTSGRKIKRTEEHPLWSAARSCKRGEISTISVKGWVKCSDLKPGDLVGVTETHQAQGQSPQSIDLIKLVAYIMGDGGLTNSNITFTQLPGRVLTELTNIVKRTKGELKPTSDGITYRIYWKDRQSPTRKFIRDSLGFSHSRDKRLPSWCWNLPDHQLAVFINRYFSCDGWACVDKNKQCQIGISSASETLIRDVSSALIRLGIWGIITQRVINNTWYWQWSTRNSQQIKIFSEIVGIFGKEKALKNCVDCASKKLDNTKAWPHINISKGFRWDIIRSVKKIGINPTVSIEVDKHHTLVTDFIEHNTFTTLRFIASAQEQGLTCSFIDVENTFDPEFAEHLGVDLSKLAFPKKQKHANQVVDVMEMLLRSEIYDVIVLDSIAALLPKGEEEASMEDNSFGTEQAKLMSRALRKLTTANKNTCIVYINQMRENIGVMFGSKSRTSGGTAMGYYAGLRIEMVKVETLKKKTKDIDPKSGNEKESDSVSGHRVLVRVSKDKTGGAVPFSQTSFVFDYDEANIDKVEDLIYLGRTMGFVLKSGDNWWIDGYDDYKQHGRPRFKKWLSKNPEVAEDLESWIREEIEGVEE